jgi:hypothetical protein
MPTKLVFHKYILLNVILFSKKSLFTLKTTIPLPFTSFTTKTNYNFAIWIYFLIRSLRI